MYNPVLQLCEPDWRQHDLDGLVPGMSGGMVSFADISSEVFAYIFTVELILKLLALVSAQKAGLPLPFAAFSRC